ncbi:MAG: ABC-F family ATP-binding cassette domain-containing protein [Acidimicrobiales bacterium]
MPATQLSHPSSADRAVLSVTHVTCERGGAVVLRDISLKVGPRSRVGVVGANGAGKSTLLQVLAGLLTVDTGARSLDPPTATVGYLAQEHERRASETVREALARRTGVAGADDELRLAAGDLALNTREASERYDVALTRFESLGASSFDARLATVLSDLGVANLADAPTSDLSGGQEAKVALAGIELSQFDLVLLDEPTNDLDFHGLLRLEEWIGRRVGGLVVVSHDREFLERTVTSVLEIDDHSHSAQEFAGGWSGYQSERANARRQAQEAFERFREQRQQLTARAERQRQWAVVGVKNEKKKMTDHDTAQRDFRINRTEKLASKARQSERALERLEEVEKPFEGWDLRFRIDEVQRAGDVVAHLAEVSVSRPAFTLGPLILEIAWGERVALTGANGSGKSTLLQVMLGELEPSSGARSIGPGVVLGALGQDRRVLNSDHDTVRYVSDRCALALSETRSLLAKFALGAAEVTRPASTLSPGQRTRVELAVFQALGVNFLVLDEPTNHLDLPAIEQLEQALASFTGTLLVTSHDRRLLEVLHFTRTLAMENGRLSEVDAPPPRGEKR